MLLTLLLLVLPAADEIAVQLPSYPLTTCVVSDEPLEADTLDLLHEGRLVRLCCKGCVKDFEAAPAEVMAKIDAAVIAAQKPSYPLATCPVCVEELGEEAVDHVHGTRLVRLCGAECVEAFAEESAAPMGKVDAALIEAQKKDYPLTTCPLTGEELGEAPTAVLHGTRLVLLCCKKCTRDFQRAPAGVLAKLDEAQKR